MNNYGSKYVFMVIKKNNKNNLADENKKLKS